MKLRTFLAISGESFSFAIQNIRSNVLRTLLSLLGITIGVFCIIGVFTFVDSIEYNVRDSISRFGDNVVLIQKMPWIFSSEYPWWKYEGRPEIKYREMQVLQKRFKNAEGISFSLFIPDNELKYGSSSADEILIRAVTDDYPKTVNTTFMDGRFFSPMEMQQGSASIIIGYQLASILFGKPELAVGKTINTLGRKLRVVGVVAKQGKAMGIGGDQDKLAIVPLNFARNIMGTDKQQFGPSIFVKGKPGVPVETLEDEIRGYMRAIRCLGPRQDDNFALNKVTLFLNFMTTFFAQVNLFGWVIAGFSILVGGFGIANIMFVSVRERTPIIGIQKSLGAKGYFILIQFLSEAVLLCVLGGAIGMLLIFLICQVVNAVMDLNLALTVKNILLGVCISSVIGILSGLIPSLQAASMDPVEAIRQGI